jgi:hypothetical protein
MPQTINVAKIRRHLERRTTLELCDDFVNLVNAKRRMTWAEQSVSDALFARNEVAWLEWQMSGSTFGPARPHPFFGLI